VTFPKKLMEHLNLKEGDAVELMRDRKMAQLPTARLLF